MLLWNGALALVCIMVSAAKLLRFLKLLKAMAMRMALVGCAMRVVGLFDLFMSCSCEVAYIWNVA